MIEKIVVIILILSNCYQSQAVVNSFVTYAFPENETSNEIYTLSTEFTWSKFSQKVDHFSANSKYFDQVFKKLSLTKQKTYYLNKAKIIREIPFFF